MFRGATITLLTSLGVLLAAVVIVAYGALPSFLESRSAQVIQEELALESPPRVELERGSPSEVLSGRFSGGTVTMRGVPLDGVRAEEVVVNLAPMDLDLAGSVLGGEVQSEGPLSGTFRGTLSQAEVLRVVRAGADVPVRDLRLEKGGVLVGTEASVLGLAVPFSVRGDLEVRSDSLVFEPERATALGTDVPPEIAEQVLGGVELSFSLEGLPYGAELSGLQVAQNRLVLSGEMRRIKLGSSG